MRLNFPVATGNPRELPELRAALVDLARGGGAWEYAEVQRLLVDALGVGNVSIDGQGRIVISGDGGFDEAELQRRINAATWHARNTIRWYRESLPQAQLIHVSPEMTEFIVAAAEAVPADMALSIEDAPSPRALVVFGSPVWGTDAGPERLGGAVRVDGVIWGEVMLPPRDVAWWERMDESVTGETVPGVAIASLRMLHPDHTDAVALEGRGVSRPMWLPLGRTDWPWGDACSLQPTEYLPHSSEGQWVSMMEDRRLLAALWAVINQKRLVDTHEVTADRHSRRRIERAGHPRRDERVTIVHLRRTESRTVEPNEGGRKMSVRFPVRPFYRRQAYGPGRSLRKIVLVPAHWRGPDDAPIVHAERVWSVDR